MANSSMRNEPPEADTIPRVPQAATRPTLRTLSEFTSMKLKTVWSMLVCSAMAQKASAGPFESLPSTSALRGPLIGRARLSC